MTGNPAVRRRLALLVWSLLRHQLTGAKTSLTSDSALRYEFSTSLPATQSEEGGT